MNYKALVSIIACALMVSCSQEKKSTDRSMIVVDPVHFHASLVQKTQLDGVSDTVRVYAPEGEGLDAYLAYVDGFNKRAENPTHWVVEVNPLESIPDANPGDFAVVASQNLKKADYILSLVSKGYNVLCDKPFAINPDDYQTVLKAYDLAAEKGLTIYDLMTERYDVMNAIARKILMDKEFFGDLNGEVKLSSVHHLYKNVAGSVLRRPAWYYDIKQQGDGVSDVATHLVDLIFWQCFPDQPVRQEDIKLNDASLYPTQVTLEQYKMSTGEEAFPDYLAEYVKDTVLQLYCNGIIKFNVKGIPAMIDAKWDYEAPEGVADTYEAEYPGTKAKVNIIQNDTTQYKEILVVTAPEDATKKLVESLKADFPTITMAQYGEGRWVLDVAPEDRPEHEARFNLTCEKFLQYVNGEPMPEWEKANTITKYYLTTSAGKYIREHRNAE